MGVKIEIRCKREHCNRLLMNYYLSGKNVSLNLEGIEVKCGKCGRVIRLKSYTEQTMIDHSLYGELRV